MPDVFDGLELTPEQQQALQVFRRSNDLLNKLWVHPDHATTFKKQLKTVDPSLSIPDIELAEQYAGPINEKLSAYEKRIEEQDKTLAALKQEREDEKQLGDLQKRIEAAGKKHRLTEEGVKAAVDRMRETGSSDVEAAMAWVVSEIEPAAPSTGSNFEPAKANIFGMNGADEAAADADRKMLHNDPDKWQAKEFNKIMDEFARAEGA